VYNLCRDPAARVFIELQYNQVSLISSHPCIEAYITVIRI